MPTFARPEHSAVMGKASAVTKEQPNRWKTRLTGDQVDEIREILDGFPTAGWVQAPDAVPAG